MHASMNARVIVPLAGLALLAAASDSTLRIPLQPGVTIVTALSDSAGDYESIKSIQAVTADAVTLAYSADIPGSAAAGGKPRQISTRRTVRREDLRSAHEYMQVFNPSLPETIAGTTALGASSAVLSDLKVKGQSSFTFQTPGRQPSMDRVLAALTGGGDTPAKNLGDLGKQLDTSKASGVLTRVESTARPFPVLVNGRRATLPAIHARGTFDDLHVDFYFLDDPENPIALKWTTGSPTGALQVVQITYPAPQEGPRIEQTLETSGRVEVHGIYFDFGSATIRAESEPALKEIADALAKNSGWTVRVEGHTDNIGGDAANMELSKRRADAVKEALTARYRVDPAKLTTAGFGATRPKEPNDTAEGRARNRRVELVRQ
jgi:outer membrane protein OmpA-like peptidoglycan-associated protein